MMENVETWQRPNVQKSCSFVVIQQPARVWEEGNKKGAFCSEWSLKSSREAQIGPRSRGTKVLFKVALKILFFQSVSR